MSIALTLLLVLLLLLGAPLFSAIGASAMLGFAGQETDLSIVAIEFYGLAETPISNADCLRVIETVFACYQSAATRQAVKVG